MRTIDPKVLLDENDNVPRAPRPRFTNPVTSFELDNFDSREKDSRVWLMAVSTAWYGSDR